MLLNEVGKQHLLCARLLRGRIRDPKAPYNAFLMQIDLLKNKVDMLNFESP